MARLNLTFVNEVGSNLNRYRAIDVNTNEEYVFDLSRNGQIITQGTPLNATNMNMIVQAINSIEASYIKSIEQLDNGKIVITKQDDTTLELDFQQIIDTKVDCDHRYEITGNTGDEHGLAIDDQQMIIEKIVGRSVVKNQLVQPSSSYTRNGLTYTNNGNGTFNLSGTYDGTATYNAIDVSNSIYFKRDGTKYLIYLNKALGGIVSVSGYGGYNQTYNFFSANEGNDWSGRVIVTLSSGKVVNATNVYVMVINLTQMYGKGKEPTNVEDILNDIGSGYVPYNAGEIVHSNNDLVSTSGNLVEIPNFSNTTTDTRDFFHLQLDYYNNSAHSMTIPTNLISSANNRYVYSFSSETISGNRLRIKHNGATNDIPIAWIENIGNVFLPNTTYYISFTLLDDRPNVVGGLRLNDIQISADSSGTYVPHVEDKLVVSRSLKMGDYIDNLANVKVTKMAEVDLGTLSWNRVANDGGYFFRSSVISNFKPHTSYNTTIPNLICSKFNARTYADIWNNSSDNIVSTYENLKQIVIICNTYTDATSFKNSLSGVKLVYELETPISEPISLPQGMQVWKNGLQSQVGTIPYVITKRYALSLASQVKANIDVDREQQKQLYELANQVITNDKIENNSISGDKIEDQSIDSSKIVIGTINGDVIKEAAVDERHLVDGSVTTAKIRDKAVTKAKLSQDVQNVLDTVGTIETTVTSATIGNSALDGRISSLDELLTGQQTSIVDLETAVGNIENDISPVPVVWIRCAKSTIGGQTAAYEQVYIRNTTKYNIVCTVAGKRVHTLNVSANGGTNTSDLGITGTIPTENYTATTTIEIQYTTSSANHRWNGTGSPLSIDSIYYRTFVVKTTVKVVNI